MADVKNFAYEKLDFEVKMKIIFYITLHFIQMPRLAYFYNEAFFSKGKYYVWWWCTVSSLKPNFTHFIVYNGQQQMRMFAMKM